MVEEYIAKLSQGGTKWTYLMLSHWNEIVCAILAIYLVSQSWKVFSRLYLHPLSGVPGPRLASISTLYGFYYNYIQDGTYSKQFAGLHKKYGEYFPSPLSI